MARKAKRIYRAAAGAPFNSKMAPRIGAELERLGDHLTPDEVVEAARNKKSALNKLIDWNNASAADSWRRQQARMILNHLNVVVIIDGKPREIRAFYSQPVIVQEQTDDLKERSERRYIHIQVAKRSSDVARNIVDIAKEDLEAWRKRYQDLRGYFEPVFSAIETVAIKPEKSNAGRSTSIQKRQTAAARRTKAETNGAAAIAGH